jgi:integrase
MTSNTVNIETYSDEDWFESYPKERTRACAKTSINIFTQFCQHMTGLNGKSKDTMIGQYKTWFKPRKVKDEDGDYYYPDPDVRSICLSLKKFVKFMQEDHPEIVFWTNPRTGHDHTFKAKSLVSIKLYFGFVKTYLRVVHGVKLTSEDIKDFRMLEKPPKEARQPIPLELIKKFVDSADPRRRCMYLCLVSSGMRIGELLSLKKSNFSLNENPIRIKLHAKDTKTGQSRETYISSEAFEKLKSIWDKTGEDEYLFLKYPTVYSGVKNEVKNFMNLRRRLNLDKKIDGSIRAVYTLHGLRGYFFTKATQTHGEQYANRLIGHDGYLPNYYQLTEKQRGEMYLKLEPNLFVESIQLESDKLKDKVIEDMQQEILELKAFRKRQENSK